MGRKLADASASKRACALVSAAHCESRFWRMLLRGFPRYPAGPFSAQTERTRGPDTRETEFTTMITNYKVRHNITTNTNVHLIMRTIKPQLMF